MSLLRKINESLRNPNFLTMFRVAAAPGIVVLLLLAEPARDTALQRLYTFAAALLFSAAAISDYFDGYFARTLGMVSNFGKIMDPVADKLLVSSSFIMLVSLGWIPGWVICLIIGRELAITGLRIVLVETGVDVSASWLGKYKTGFQIASIIPLLIHFRYFGLNFHAIGMFFLWGSLIFTLWSGVDYILKARKLIEI